MKAAGTSAARAGSQLHLTHGRGSSVALTFVRSGSSISISRVCWPAVTISGVRFWNAVMRVPIPLPTPTPVWRLTITGLRSPCASPSAMPMTLAS
ncbi:hypothetical protein [Segnochrobactrum spirostomi]|uniref:hypothetical protein n=1 Tax=Segnochrobactrum spirostomi TaxID=2608987 RepID=UPI001AD81BA5